MPINTDFYGLKTDWITVSNARYDVKKAAWTDSATAAAAYGSLDTLVRSPIYNSDNMATVPLDSSIIPWKVGENSKVFQRKYCELSFPNHTSDTPVIADFFNQSANYKESDENAIKNVNGYRFFPAYYTVVSNSDKYIDNSWDVRYAPYNYKNEFLNGTAGTAPYKSIYPVVSFDYSRTVSTVQAALIPKVNLDDYASISSDPHVNKYYNNKTPDYQATYKDLNTLTDSDLVSNYLVGFLFNVYSGGDTQHAGISITLVPFDEHLAVPAYQWGGTTGQGYPYQKDFTCYTSWVASDSNRIIFCQLGGATSFVNPANCGIDGAEPTTYNAQYYETKGMRTMNTDDFEGEGLEVGSWTITTNTGSGSLENGRVNSWFIPKCYNNLTVAQIRTAIFKELAYLGFWFTDDIYYARYVDMENHPEKYYLPEINSQGITTGNYKAYSEASDEINFEWNTNVYEKTPYDSTKDNTVDPNTYDDNNTVLNTLSTIYDRFTNEYILNGTQLLALKNELYTTISSTVDSSFWSEQKFLTNNPLDVVKSLTFYPFDVANKAPNTGTLDNDHIVLGTINTDVSATALIDSFIVIDCGSCTYFPVYGVNDFRSYAPYSSAELHIPYCGSVEISPELYLNHTISVKMIVDLKTGAALALIYRDGMVIDSVGGTVGITIPISGIERETLAAAEHQALSQYKTARNTAIGNIAHTATSIGGTAFDVLGTIGGGKSSPTQMQSRFTRTLSSSGQHASDIMNVKSAIQNVRDAQYDLQHINIPYKTIGTASSVTSYANEPYCRLIIKRPIMLDGYSQSDFGHCYGFATNKTGVVSDFSGYTQFASVDLSGVNCSESMKAQIKAIMLSGVRI